jgi:hypothetical protein
LFSFGLSAARYGKRWRPPIFSELEEEGFYESCCCPSNPKRSTIVPAERLEAVVFEVGSPGKRAGAIFSKNIY